MNRVEKHALAVQLLGEGNTRKQVAVTLGLSYSGLQNILCDPDGSKQKARRERYKGTCARCGGKTEGSGGYKTYSVHCKACAAIVQHEEKKWTREAVIAAIQLWAAEHNGTPPTARNWQEAHEDRRFPGTTSVYRTSTSPNVPFAKWADAIEAAGFPRPLIGIYGDRQPWPPERIIAAIRTWAETHGSPPTSEQWARAANDHPCANSVVYHFGTWNAAIAAAGFTPRRVRKAA